MEFDLLRRGKGKKKILVLTFPDINYARLKLTVGLCPFFSFSAGYLIDKRITHLIPVKLERCWPLGVAFGK